MGAEPTLNPALPELIRYATRLGLRANISTNAVRLASWDYLLALHEAGLSTIELSFPYPDEAVYARITRAKPSGFSRLLQALDNIARLNRSSPAGRGPAVHVNLVVSRFNIDRLDEVIGHLTRHLAPGSFIVTLKRVGRPLDSDEKIFSDVSVSCAELRRILPRLAVHAAAGVRLGFRDLPLCAIPGLEMRDDDLGYWLNEVRVRQNFFKQERMEDMYPQQRARGAHPFAWICENCGLDPICLSRDLFLDADSMPEYAPRPLLGEIPEGLRAGVRASARGEDVWTNRLGRTILGWALSQILKSAPPGRPLAGSSLEWFPLQDGVIPLSDEAHAMRLRLSAVLGAKQGARFSFAPFECKIVPRWAAPGVAALEAVLRSLPQPPEDCLPAHKRARESMAVLSARARKWRLGPLGAQAQFGGFSVVSVEPGPDRYVTVTLKSRAPRRDGGDDLVVRVESLQGATRYYKAVGPLAFSYSDTTPLRTQAQIGALAALMVRLGQHPEV